MSSMSPEQNTDLPRASHQRHMEALIEMARREKMTLRDLWYETVDSGPALSARLNVAARLAHNAAEALSPQTLL